MINFFNKNINQNSHNPRRNIQSNVYNNKNNFKNQNFNINNNAYQNMPHNLPSGINFKPLTNEDLKKLQEEIQENIKKVNDKNTLLEESIKNINISEFLQDEQNSGIFYKNLSKKLKTPSNSIKIKNISDECFLQVENLKKLYFKINSKDFEVEDPPLNIYSNTEDSIILAINEELSSYEKICKILEKDIPKDFKAHFDKMAFHKLKRIITLQFLLIQS